MLRRPPRSTRTSHSFPTRRSSDLRQKRWSSDPQWTINRRMSAGVKSSLGDGKNGRSWETLVGYTVADLIAHLERQFFPGMSWANRGEWHIAHKNGEGPCRASVYQSV